MEKFTLIQDINRLKEPCQPCDSWQQGHEIAQYLIHCMKEMPHAVGLAANQVGIDRRVCILWMDRGQEPYTFINPKISKHSYAKFQFTEGCLSFPGEQVLTKRSSKVWIEHMGKNEIIFYDSYEAKDPATGLFLAALQHEVDHLDGITMHERRISF